MPTNHLVDRLKETLAALEREFKVEIPERIRHAREQPDERQPRTHRLAAGQAGALQIASQQLRLPLDDGQRATQIVGDGPQDVGALLL